MGSKSLIKCRIVIRYNPQKLGNFCASFLPFLDLIYLVGRMRGRYSQISTLGHFS